MGYWNNNYWAGGYWFKHWMETARNVVAFARGASGDCESCNPFSICLPCLNAPMCAAECFSVPEESSSLPCRYGTAIDVRNPCRLQAYESDAAADRVQLCNGCIASPNNIGYRVLPLLITPGIENDPMRHNWDVFFDLSQWRAGAEGTLPEHQNDGLFSVEKYFVGSVDILAKADIDSDQYCNQTGDDTFQTFISSFHTHYLHVVQRDETGGAIASGGAGWKYFCTRPNVQDCNDLNFPASCVSSQYQCRARKITLHPARFGFGFLQFHAFGDGEKCFSIADTFCYRSFCGDGCSGLSGHVVNCDGQSEPDRADSLRAIRIVMNTYMREDPVVYPHSNPADVEIMNDVLGEAGEWLTEIGVDSDGTPNSGSHFTRQSFDSQSLNLWRKSGFYNNLPGSPDWPVVRDWRHTFPDIDQFSLPTVVGGVSISLTSRLTGLVIPAQLTLYRWNVTIRMSLEVALSPVRHTSDALEYMRRWGSVRILITCRIRVNLDDIPIDYDWLPFIPFGGSYYASDLDNLLVIYPPGDPKEGQIVENEVLIPRGPDGSRVPINTEWRGLMAPSPFGRGDPWQKASDELFHRAYTCCQVLHHLHGFRIFGENNDFMRDEEELTRPQRYQGNVQIFNQDLVGGANPVGWGCGPG